MSRTTIQIANQQAVVAVDRAAVRRTVREVLRARGVRGARVSVAVVDDSAMRELKKAYYGMAEATDVLSFDLGGEEGEEPPGEESWSLDIEVVVNAQRAQREAAGRRAEVEGELHLYLVHGLLHQMGYDDGTAAAARAMHEEEDRLLTALGYGAVYSSKRAKR